MKDSRPVIDWLEAFAACVRERDFEAGRALFDGGVRGFGTRTEVMDDLDSLCEEQWRPTWLRTRDFVFELDSVRIFASEDQEQFAVTSLWRSYGVDSPESWETQEPHLRRGRCSLVLQRHADGELRAAHSHFSMRPVSAPRS